MIAQSRQLPRNSLHDGARFGALMSLARRAGPALAVAFGFLTFMPCAAIPIGSHSAIQVGDLLSVLLTAGILLLSWRRRPFYLYPLILAPLCLSALKVAVTDNGDLTMCFKVMPALALSVLTLLPAQLLAPRHSLHLLTGIAAATLLHVAVGFWQMHGFSVGELPLRDLYVNQSFLSVQENATTIANYIQRPFGLFPEPSAMSSSLAPWVLFWIAELFGLVQLRQEPARWQRLLFAVAAMGGLTLIILSKSGHAIITLAAAMGFALAWFRRCKATTHTYHLVVLVFGVLLPIVIWLAAVSLNDRINGGSAIGNDSWKDRSSSLRIGFWLVAEGDLPTLLLGMGVGQMGPVISHAARLDAVWSVLLNYIYETGLVGLLVVCWIGQYLGRIWRASNFNAVFPFIVCVWLIGITLTTSYPQLLPLWVTLGWLTVWPEVCVPAPAERRLRHSLPSAGLLAWTSNPNRRLRPEL